MGKVIPLFKNGDRTSTNNYRPITILPTLSKIIEKAVHSQIYEYTQEHNLLAPEQFGFRPNRSTEVALAHLTDHILDNLDNGLITGAVFLDLSKAFDTVDHPLLLTKLKDLGLDDNATAWFNSYLSNRHQVTSIGNEFSSPKLVSVGVPQGSILGPLLFLIYVNDLPRCLKHCKSILYADDTLIYYSSKSSSEIESNLNNDLEAVANWLRCNLLTLNCVKSKSLLFGSRHRLKSFNSVSLTINESPLDRVTTFKYLGVTLNEDLTWIDHLENLTSKIKQRLAILRRVKHLLPYDARITLFNALILPLFDYADVIWGDKNNVTLMNTLQVQQNKAAKLILDKPMHFSATQALEILNWKRLDSRRHEHRCTFIFKCLNNFFDSNFELLPNSNFHQYHTRNKAKLHLPRAKTNWGKHKLIYHALIDFNNLDSDFYNIKSLPLFKLKLRK